MKQLSSLAVAGVAFAAMSQPIYAKPEKEKAGRGGGIGGGRAEVRQRAVQQTSRVMRQPARNADMQRSVTQAPRTQVRTQARVGTSNRPITRTQPSVAFGGQTRAERR